MMSAVLVCFYIMSEAEQSVVLDRQLDIFKSAFEGFRYDTHPVSVCPVKSSDIGHFDDPLAGLHAQVDNLGAPENNAEIVFLMKHLKKGEHCLLYANCQSDDCEHCRSCPNKAPEFMKCLREKFACRLPLSSLSANDATHMTTYLELYNSPILASQSYPTKNLQTS